MATNKQAQMFSELTHSRRSTRDFLDTPVAPELLDEVLQEALSAPSWSNTRPYRVAVATGEVKERISQKLLGRFDDIMRTRSPKLRTRLKGGLSALSLLRSDFRIPITYPDDLRARQVQLGKALFSHLGVARGDVEARNEQIRRNMRFFGAPVGLFFFARKGMGVYSPLDAGHFMQTLMLSAKARGLDTCAQGFLAFWSGPIRDEFDVPEGYKLLCGMSLGYAAESHTNEFVPPVTELQDIALPLSQK
ncbi:nitroreductase [Pontimonas sp.]|uniref:nitroreductase n=1 Tax=Pontimonas sp. TaxID=2304492 RepID=UPI00287051EC|nr:nitroreductase [Pontimonas sp.]MDR9396972.1 nitroreductase [Pontimonas sp.]MDR9434870.1 nitroreductase [Pontimonas sp.]